MKIFMEYVNRGILSAMVNGYIIPTHVVDNKFVEKPYESWSHYTFQGNEHYTFLIKFWWFFHGVRRDVGFNPSHTRSKESSKEFA